MIHIFKQGLNNNTLLLLHGTGGDEKDLLEIGNIIDSEANILSVRGNVLEGNMPRFFKRLKEGVFDIEDLIFRTNELNSFVDEASKKYGFERDRVIAVGYSNGANIAGNLLFSIKDSLLGGILFRPMVPQRGVTLPDLGKTKVFIAAGRYDNICPPSESIELEGLLKNANSDVHIEWLDSNHRLTYQEFEIAKTWYNNNFK